MNYKKLSVTDRLAFSKDAIEVVLKDSTLRIAFDELGYTRDRLSTGLALEGSARALWMKQQVEYGTRVAATDSVKSKYQEVVRSFGKNRVLARLVLRDNPGLSEKLRLNGRIDRKRERLVLQAQHFYIESMKQPDILDRFQEVGLTKEVLQDCLDEVYALSAYMQYQQRQMGHAKATTEERRVAMDELDKWVLQFLAIARARFKYDPGQLEKMGI